MRSTLKISSTIKIPVVLMLGIGVLVAQTYYPPSESGGGWRRCQNEEDVRSKAGMDPKRLQLIGQEHALLYSGPWAIVIIKNGYLVAEWFGVPTMPATTFDAWSCTKSATGIAFGMLFDDSRNHRLPGDVRIDLESPAYDFLPEGHPLTDPRKEKILMKHLLTMTSGIPGQAEGLIGIAVSPGKGEYELALGKDSNRFGIPTAALTGEPGTRWNYSDAAFASFADLLQSCRPRDLRLYERACLSTDRRSERRLGSAGRRRAYRSAHERA